MTDEQSATASKRALSDNDELDVDYGLHSAVYHLLMVSADLSSTRHCLIVVCMIEPRAVGASQVEARGCQRAEEAAERETCRGRDDLQRRPQGRRCGHWPEGLGCFGKVLREHTFEARCLCARCSPERQQQPIGFLLCLPDHHAFLQIPRVHGRLPYVAQEAQIHLIGMHFYPCSVATVPCSYSQEEKAGW